MSGTIRGKTIVLDTSTTIDKKINLSSSELTISDGEVTITTSYHTITPETGPNDDLDTINGGTDGDMLFIRCATNKQITLKNGTGNLDLVEDHLLVGGSSAQLFYDGTNWTEISVTTNKGPTLTSDGIAINNAVQPNTITLTFSKNLESTSAENTSNYTITNNAGSITYNIANASLSGSVVTLTLATVNPDVNTTFITTSDANAGIKVTPTSSIIDLLGSAFSGATVFDNGNNVTSDVTAPTLANTSILIDNANQPNTIALTFSEKLNKTTAETAGNFTVTNNDNSITYSVASSALNNEVITLTLSAVDTDTLGTYITNSAANTGVKILPSTSLLDVSGYAYSGSLVTGSANDTDHILDQTAPTLASSAIKINNNSQPHTIELTFNEKLTKAVGEDEGNWIVKNNSNGITYNIANAAISNNLVTLTLGTATGHDTSSYITTSDANAGLRVTPNANITDIAGKSYVGGEVLGNANDPDHIFDESSPSIYTNQIEIANTGGGFVLSNRIELPFNENLEKTQVETLGNWNVTNNGETISYGLANVTLNSNHRFILIRLVPLDTANANTYITNSDANTGIIVTASNTVTDLAGNKFNGISVTGDPNLTGHSLNIETPILSQSNIQVDTTARPHQITLTFDVPMNKTLCENENNWSVVGGSNGTSYNIASASANNAVVTLTLDPVNTSDPNTYITSDEVTGIQITPNSNLTNVFGASYTNSTVTESGASHSLDTTVPTLNSTAIAVNNVSDPQTITLTFSEPLRQTPGETTSNWNVTNTGASQGYIINTASVNNDTVVLTLPTADPNNTATYITNSDANVGLVVTPDSNIIDVYGVAYTGGAITGVANDTDHTLNLVAPVLTTGNIDVTNTNDNNHSVQLEFSQKIEKIQGETVGNMIVSNNSGGLVYSIKEISVANQNLNITLSDCSGSNINTYITNNHVTEGIKVTPSVNITNLAGIPYSGAQITANSLSNNTDNTAPTASLAYNTPSVGAATKVKEGTTLTITSTFSERMADAYPPIIEHSANGAIPSLNPTPMTKTSDTEWYYNYTVPTGNGSIYPTLSVGRDLPGKTLVSVPTSGTSIYIDNTAPTISSIVPSFGDWLNLTEDDSNKTVVVTPGSGLETVETGQKIYIKITDDSLSPPSDYVDMPSSMLNGEFEFGSATIYLDSSDLQVLTDGKTYTISVVNANDVSTYPAKSLIATTDLAGNEYTGTISTQFTYDITKPVLNASSIQVNNSVQPNQITLTFTEELTTTTANNVSYYTVKNNNNGITYGLVSANKTGNAVTLTLDTVDTTDNTTFITTSDAQAGIRVTPSTNLEDLAENNYAAGEVLESGASHTVDSNNPTFLATNVTIDNSVQPNTIEIAFDQKMDIATTETESNWTVTNNSNSVQYSISNAALSSDTVTLTLVPVNSSNDKTFITTSDITDKIRVTPSTNVTNVVGTASLGAEVVAANSGHTLDTTAPTLAANSIVVDNTSRPHKVTVTFSEALDKNAADTEGNWLLANGAYVVSTAVANNDTVVLSLPTVDAFNSNTFITNTAASGITVTPSVNIVDLCGVNAYAGGEITESGATHILDNTAPTLAAANIQINNSVQPNQIILTFNEELDKAGAETLDHWSSVKDNTEAITYQVASASANNAVVTLTLTTVDPTDNTTFITNNDATAGIKITPNTIGFKDIAGNAYTGGSVTESGASHTVDNNPPEFLSTGVVIDNAVQPNTIAVTFDQKLDLASAVTEGNWSVTDNSGSINYSIANASLSDNVVTLTLSAADSSNDQTFITSTDAGAGIKITPTTSLLNVVGKPSAGALVIASNSGHTLDDTAPTLSASDISVNTSVTPNTIAVTFSEKVTKNIAEDIDNWAVANSTGLLTYSLASASADNETVVLTMSAINSSNNQTFILNTEAPTIRVTPSTNIVDLAGTNAYANGAVTASGGSHTLDNTGPTLASANIQVNNSVQPNRIILTFDEPLDKDGAETLAHWSNVKNNTSTITYTVASASANNAVVTLTLPTVDPTDSTTFITNNDATAGIKIVPNTSGFKDVAGIAYSDGLVTESGASHTIDNNPPEFLSTGVVIDNSIQPNTIAVTFDQKLNLASAETEANWGVTDNAGSINYSIANASLSDNIVTLTLDTVNPANDQTFITTSSANAGIKITPSVSLLNVVGKPSAGAQVVVATSGHTIDSNDPTFGTGDILINNTARPNTIAVTFDQKLDKTSSETANNWTVTDASNNALSIASSSLSDNVVTLTMSTLDDSNSQTYITQSQANAGIKITPSTSLLNVVGTASLGAEVVGAVDDGDHILDTNGPTLSTGNIQVNNSVQPNQIALTFDQTLDQTTAETVNNWTVTNNASDQTYTVSSASLTSSNVVTLTLPAVNSNNESTYITNTEADAGLKVTPGTGLINFIGAASDGVTITGVANDSDHILDSTAPTIALSDIVINNTTDPNTVTVTFSEPVTKATAEITSNWPLTDGDSISYTISSASANNDVVTLTLAARDPEDNKTFITNTVAGTGINVTPSTNITDVSGVAYAQGTRVESGASHTLDNTGPTLAASDIDVDNSVQPNTITMTFSEKLEELAAENTSNWLVKDNGNNITYVLSTSTLADNVVTLTLVSPSTSNTSTYITNNQATGGIRVTPSVNLSDLAGVSYSGDLVTASGGTYTVDETSPSASLAYNISGVGVVTSAKQGEVVRVTATFDELMADSPSLQIQHAATGTVDSLSATNMTKSNGTSWYYDYTIPGGNGVANLTLATGTDLAGKLITSVPTSGGSITIDNNAPTAALIYTYLSNPVTHARNGQTVRITAAFDQSIEDSPLPKIQHALSGTVNALSATDMTKVSTTEYYYDYSIPVGDGTVNPTLSTCTDGTRNEIQSTPTSGTDLVIDNTSPVIASIVPSGVIADNTFTVGEYPAVGEAASIVITVDNIEEGVSNSAQVQLNGQTYYAVFSSNIATVNVPDVDLNSMFDGSAPGVTVYPVTITCYDKAGNSIVDTSLSITVNK